MERIIQCRFVSLVVCFLLLCGITSGKGAASASAYRRGAGRWMFSAEMISSYKGTLREEGYDVNDIGDIKRAATTAISPFVRDKARRFLAYQFGPRAIPTLKQALDASHPSERCSAARLLGILGDRSGLERMRRDIAQLTEANEQDEAEADSKTAQKDQPLFMRSQRTRLRYALRAARVLAEFGDTGGYELAARTAIESTSAMLRVQAIYVLSEFGRIDKAALEAKGVYPEDYLLAVAELETNAAVLQRLTASVMTNMRPESKVRILEKILKSPHMPVEQRQIAQRGLKDAKEHLEQAKCGHGDSKNQDNHKESDKDEN
jgi:hypothetical protein